MNYVICKSPVVRMDLMCDQAYAPQLVGYIERMRCTYKEECVAEPGNGRKYVVFKDIQGPNGSAIGELLGLFYSLEWGNLLEGETQRKFYILLNPKRKGKKKHVREDRKEADAGSDGEAGGESSDDSGSEQVDGSSGDGIDAWDVSIDDPCGIQGE